MCPVQDDPAGNKIGRLKKVAASLGGGEILLELDADDILTEDCLAEVVKAFENPEVMMAYSNDARFHDGSWKPDHFSERWGWINRPFNWHGHELVESVAWPPTAHSIRRVEWAGDHVRAWRRTGYAELGGHNESLVSGDDHELMIRSYLLFGERGMRHIDKCLYLYRVHRSTSVVRNDEVQQQVYRNYLNYIGKLAQRWANDHKLPCIDLGGGIDPATGFEVADLTTGTDLNKPWPWFTSTVGVFRANHILEHLKDSIHSFNELYRCLAPGGWVLLEVPSTDGWGAHCDPTHISFFNPRSLRYYTESKLSRYIPRYVGKFQAARIEQYYMEPNVPVLASELIALKPGYDRPAGEVLI